MAVYEVTWTAKIWYTRVIEANSRREAMEITEDTDASVLSVADLDIPLTLETSASSLIVNNEVSMGVKYKVSGIKAKEVKDVC